MAGAATPALAELAKAGVPHKVVKFDRNSSDPRERPFGVEVIHALRKEAGTVPEQIYSTERATG